MDWLLILTLAATALNGTLAGGSVDTALVKLPARRRIGNLAYATFARGNDLGNGLIVYPVWAAGAALLVFISTILAAIEQRPGEQLLPLAVASLTSVVHFLCAARAAPIMLSLKNTPNDEALLKEKLDRFERWHAIRMVFQVLTFGALLWGLVVLHTV